jgi:hypothetical protein
MSKGLKLEHLDEAGKKIVENGEVTTSRGVLQACNRMDIASLLNPDGESQVLTETSDNEIYQSVIDAIKARENLEINGGDDVDDEFEIVEPRPTRRDVLKAVSTINKYIDELDSDPVSRKIEGLLGQFNRQLRFEETKNMKDTVLTNYF